MPSLFKKTTFTETQCDTQQSAMQEAQVCPQVSRKHLPRCEMLRKVLPAALLSALVGLGASGDPSALVVRDFATHSQYTAALGQIQTRVEPVKGEREVAAENVPKLAGRFFALGTVAAASGFVALWFTDSGIPALILAAGLALNAICLRAGEQAIANVRHR